jgi:ribose transport system ATP-binding protein
MRGISKAYPGVQALAGVDFDVMPGEVHALAGENGAGKSTLMKIMAGAVMRDAGEILWNGAPLRLDGPADALAAGIRIIYQELNLVPHLSVAENIFLGREPVRGGLVDWRRMREEARRVLEPLGVPIDPRAAVASLPVGRQQLVEIAKALAAGARVIAMDEPTSALTDQEAEHLFALIGALKAQGVSLIYISHRLEELQRVADRVTVFRDGRRIETRPMKDTSIPHLIRLMVGRTLEEEFPKRELGPGDVALRVEGLVRAGVLHDVTLDVRKGEILGVAGLMGSGRTELMRAIFGADPVDAGRILLDGRPVRIDSPAEAIRHGIALVPEDRKQQGLVLGMTVRENMTLARLRAVTRAGWVRRGAERGVAERLVKDLGVRTPSVEQVVRNLSGGNQQKVVLAKWLFTEAKVLIFDEPTRGIDVGAKAEIYELMNRLAAQGIAILMVSSELPEVLGMSDRVAVMHEGRLAGVLSRAEATPERVMHLATGQARAA